MGSPSFEYLLPPGPGIEEVLAQLRLHWRLIEDPLREFSRVFYDTFDWALHADGGVLERRSDLGGVAPELIWSPLDTPSETGGEPLSQPAPEEPSFGVRLPQGPVRARIREVVGIRRLLPMMRLETRTRGLQALDGGSTPWRADLVEIRFQDPCGGGAGPLRPRIRVEPLGGDGDARDLLLGQLASCGLRPTPVKEPLLVEALAAAGREPGDYSSKIDFRLDPEARADTVAKTILRGLLETIERNREGARDNLDPEFLHDLRVAVRRTRSAITQIRAVLPKPVVDHYKGRFAWVHQVTGPVRDLDVYLLDFDDYQRSLPPPLRPHLEPMRTFILTHYDEEQRRLAGILGGSEFEVLLVQWRAFLEAPVPDRPTAKDAGTPIEGVADARIWRMVKRVRREGRAITPESPPEEVHELRKSCKKLRYLMEFFQSLYPADEIQPLIRHLKDLLDHLGSFQDLAVQAAHLSELARRMRSEGQGDTDTLLAMGALIGQVLKRQQRVRKVLDKAVAEFLARDSQDRIRRLFHPDRTYSTQDPDAEREPPLAAVP